jgi:hypothetical protein
VGRALSNLGEVAQAKGDLWRAHRLYRAAVCLFEKAGSPFQEYSSGLLRQVMSMLKPQLTAETADASNTDLRSKSLDEIIRWALADNPAPDSDPTKSEQNR